MGGNREGCLHDDVFKDSIFAFQTWRSLGQDSNHTGNMGGCGHGGTSVAGIGGVRAWVEERMPTPGAANWGGLRNSQPSTGGLMGGSGLSVGPYWSGWHIGWNS